MLQDGIPVAVGIGDSEVLQLLLAEPDGTPELAEKVDGISVGTVLEVAVNIVTELETLAAKLNVELGAPKKLLDVCSPLVTCVKALSELIWPLCTNALALVSDETELGSRTDIEDEMVGVIGCSPPN